jgi:hypothetical protein
VAVCVPLVQATYAIAPDTPLELIEKQPAVNIAGAWWGDPAVHSMKLEPQIAFMKPSTDIVLHGHAYPNNRERTEGLVGIRVGNSQKVARIFGNRRLVKHMGLMRATPPEPFERIQLAYEHAYGGWDRRDADTNKHSFEPRNPAGVGFWDAKQTGDADVIMPNIEDPNQLYQSTNDRPPPAGFGFISPDWLPRATFAGTYDKAWSDTRKPLLPKDFDRRFFNAASPGLIAPSYLIGNEPVTVIGTTESGRLDFTLPGLPPPACRVHLKNGAPTILQTVLDTVLVDMEHHTVTLTWRTHLTVRRGAHDVEAVELPLLRTAQLDEGK